AAAGLPPVNGPLAIGPVLRRDRIRLERAEGRWILSGEMKRVPWARNATALVVVVQTAEGTRTVVLPDVPALVEGWNYAREPRDSVQLAAYRVPDECVGELDNGMGHAELFFRG